MTTSGLSAEDRAILAEANAKAAANREHNREAIERAGVPAAARRGFWKATQWGDYRIADITEHPRDGRPSRWSVVTELYPGSYTRYGHLIGPRGACRKVY